ncbi:MFS transporter [Methyloligella solikamskensis]|uniref:Nitrate/nitrite transporter n=1 Tax=Methyloligella solikamskensis TaxID=1177756 RepID=A0ABW3J825_9HYPH
MTDTLLKKIDWTSDATRALSLSTVAFTACFAVWTIFSIIGVRIGEDLGLTETQFGLLVGTPILTGSLSRIVLGVLTDRYGGRIVFTATMVAAALATFLLAHAESYIAILGAAVGVGLAGGSFAVGVAYVSRFYPAKAQGTALGIFGVGNVGAAITSFVAPFVLVALGWQAVAQIWAGVLVAAAVGFWFLSENPPSASEEGQEKRSFWAEFEPLQYAQVWRFAAYYFFVFGGFVALALWLPRYLIGSYGFDIETAGMIGAAYSLPGAIFRAYGGYLSDTLGARKVMYWTLAVSLGACAILSMPASQVGPFLFIGIVFVLGFFMSLGKAAVYKHVPVYYPGHVGAVGGLVGMIGGLGGFFLPLAFGALLDTTGLWTSCFMLLFLLVGGLLLWMHSAVRRMTRESAESAPASEPELALQ